MQRRIEQADRHGQPGHRLEDGLEVALLHRQQLVERLATAVLALGKDHLAHDGQPVLGHEHVLGAAQADAFRSELARLRGILRGVGIRTHLQSPVLVAPAEDRLEIVVDGGCHERHLSHDHRSGTAVDREEIALGQGRFANGDHARVEVDREPFAARDTRLAHAPRHHRCV